MTAEEYIKAYTRGNSNELVHGGYHEWLTPENALAAVELAREEMKAVIKCEEKSPITGGEMQLMQEKSSVKFRGEEITFIRKFYHCVDSEQEFTDTELDNDNMWAIFRAYWERKGFEHFYDIDGYRREQEPASEDLEKASEEYAYTNWESDDYHEGASEGKPFDAIGHTQKCFIDGAQWQKEQMMKDAIDATVTGVREYREENEVDFTIMLDKGIVPYDLEEEVKVIIIKE